MNSTEQITQSTLNRGTSYSVGDLGVVASVRYQDGWIVRKVYSPDDITNQHVASRETAERMALRHALVLAE